MSSDYKWKYVDYQEDMADGTYIDDEYELDEPQNEWLNYYEEIREEIEY